MAANQTKKQESKPERNFMRGPHSSESAEQVVAETKPVDDDLNKPKAKWYQIGFPTSVYFIITNEFCERFTYYGMKAILTLYFLIGLEYDQDTSVVLYHAFAMLCYFTPILGGMIADVWWGKYLTIVILSIVYAIGNCTTAVTSYNEFPMDLKRIGCFTGLVLIGIGTGGIKPCVSSFGADQIPEERTDLRAKFFAWFYFAINAGSMLSMIITPILRTEVECGGGPCFPVAFGVPAILMIIAIGIFLIGTPLYIRQKPKGNVLVQVFKCIGRAIKNWSKFRKTNPKPNLLDYADDKYSAQFISDVRACKGIVVMMLPVPVFWALFDQTGSTWTLQAQKMDGTFGSVYILPDQFQVINPALVMAMIPLFQAFIYPLFNKCNLLMPNRLLQRMVVGGVFAAGAFVVAAVVQQFVQPTAFQEAHHGLGKVQLINADESCSYTAMIDGNPYQANPFSENQPLLEMKLENQYMEYTSPCYLDSTLKVENVTIPGRTVRNFVFNDDKYIQVDHPDAFKDATGMARVKWFNSPGMYVSIPDLKTIIIQDSVNPAWQWGFADASKFQSQPTGATIDDEYTEISIDEHTFKAMVIYGDGSNKTYTIEKKFKDGIDSSTILVLTYNQTLDYFSFFAVRALPAKTISIFWMVPQYFVITCAEILFSISGLDFAYSQAPTSMRSVMMATWLLTVAFGNLIVMILTEIQPFGPAGMSLFYATLMVGDIIIFAIMAFFYKYVEQDAKAAEAGSNSSDSSKSPSISGTPPPGYPNDGYEQEKYAPGGHSTANHYGSVAPREIDEETNL